MAGSGARRAAGISIGVGIGWWRGRAVSGPAGGAEPVGESVCAHGECSGLSDSGLRDGELGSSGWWQRAVKCGGLRVRAERMAAEDCAARCNLQASRQRAGAPRSQGHWLSARQAALLQ